MLITDKGQTIRTRVAEIRETQSRGASGVKVMTLGEGEHVVAFERLAESESTETEAGDLPPPSSPGSDEPPPEPMGEA
jgi:DNA gyrase subunit A